MPRRIAIALFALLVVGACGGDDDDDSASAIKEYCRLSEELSDEFNGVQAKTEDELVAALKKLVQENGDLMDDLQDTLPSEIKADVTKAINAIRTAAKGDLAVLKTMGDTSKVDEFDQKNCS